MFFHYSNIFSLKHLVIADPQWLVRQIAKLLPLEGFEELAGSPHLWKVFREKGILVEALYTEVLKSPEGDEKATTITPQAIVDLLEHFLILSPVNTQSKVHTFKGKEYFVPSVLPTVTEDHTSAIPTQSVKKAASLHVIFPNVNYLPPGYFIRLVTALSLKQDFYLAFGHGIYRNKVSFVVGRSDSQIDTLTLTEHKYSVQMDLTRDAPRKSGDPIFSSVCQDVLTTIQTGSIEICEWFPHIETSFAFICDKCDVSPKHFVPIKPECTTESQVRCQGDVLYPLNEDHKYWLKLKVS